MVNVTKVIHWICGECGESYDLYQQALRCCGWIKKAMENKKK